MKLFLWVWILIQTFTFAQSKYPVDTLLTNPQIPIFKKAALLPIGAWQRVSYNADFMNCQFYPSCSNYGASAIKQHGLLKGAVMASDRIIRCNPEALHYHLLSGEMIDSAGFLVDPVISIKKEVHQGKRSALTAAGLSAILPGSGRFYAGRKIEGFMSGIMVLFLGDMSIRSYKDNRSITPIIAAMFLAFYGGEIYGSYQIAKYN